MLGGETSGHLLCLDRTTTGDGLISALQVLAVMKRTRPAAGGTRAGMPKFPQVMINVRVSERVDPARTPAIQDAVRARRGGAGQARAAWCCAPRAPSP